jgi:site-specific recombinase XerD
MDHETELAKLVDGFRLYCLAEGKQHTTIRWYLGKLGIFLQYLQAEQLPTRPGQVTTTHLRAFLVHLRENVKADENNPRKPTQERGLRTNTLQGYARTLKAFFSWLAREGYATSDPAKMLKIPKGPKVIVETLSDTQVKSLLSMIDQRSPKGFRDYCLLLVLLDTGVRLSELVNLQIKDIDLERGCFKVMGKGARERLVPFGAKVQTGLWKYIHKHRPQPFHPNIDNLFLRTDGQALTPDQVYRLIRDYGEKAGLQGVRCSPHTFRHTFAKSFLLNGGDLFTLQKILGHSSLSVVRMYVDLTADDVQVQHRLHSPVDSLKVKI